MAVYIGHMYLLKGAQAMGLFDGLKRLDGPVLAGTALGVAAIVVALAGLIGKLAPWVFDFTWLIEAVKRVPAKARAWR